MSMTYAHLTSYNAYYLNMGPKSMKADFNYLYAFHSYNEHTVLYKYADNLHALWSCSEYSILFVVSSHPCNGGVCFTVGKAQRVLIDILRTRLSHSPPPPPPPVSWTGDTQEDWEWEKTCWCGGGCGSKSNDSERAWSSINHSILHRSSVVFVFYCQKNFWPKENIIRRGQL